MVGRTSRASPPPAPRSRPSARAPPLKLRGVIGRTARCPPPRPRGGEITLQYPTHKEHTKFARGHLLRSVALRSGKSPLPRYFTLDREQGALLRYESLRRSSIAPLLSARSSYAPAPLRSETPCPLSRYPPKIQPIRQKFPLPRPPPARARPPAPLR